MSDKDVETKLKAGEDLLNGLHQMVAQKLIRMVNDPVATVQDINAAIKFLKDNNVTADITYNKPLAALETEVTSVGELPFIMEEDDEAN